MSNNLHQREHTHARTIKRSDQSNATNCQGGSPCVGTRTLGAPGSAPTSGGRRASCACGACRMPHRRRGRSHLRRRRRGGLSSAIVSRSPPPTRSAPSRRRRSPPEPRAHRRRHGLRRPPAIKPRRKNNKRHTFPNHPFTTRDSHKRKTQAVLVVQDTLRSAAPRTVATERAGVGMKTPVPAPGNGSSMPVKAPSPPSSSEKPRKLIAFSLGMGRRRRSNSAAAKQQQYRRVFLGRSSQEASLFSTVRPVPDGEPEHASLFVCVCSSCTIPLG